jgi:hypothetical protein
MIRSVQTLWALRYLLHCTIYQDFNKGHVGEWPFLDSLPHYQLFQKIPYPPHIQLFQKIPHPTHIQRLIMDESRTNTSNDFIDPLTKKKKIPLQGDLYMSFGVRDF